MTLPTSTRSKGCIALLHRVLLRETEYSQFCGVQLADPVKSQLLQAVPVQSANASFLQSFAALNSLNNPLNGCSSYIRVAVLGQTWDPSSLASILPPTLAISGCPGRSKNRAARCFLQLLYQFVTILRLSWCWCGLCI